MNLSEHQSSLARWHATPLHQRDDDIPVRTIADTLRAKCYMQLDLLFSEEVIMHMTVHTLKCIVCQCYSTDSADTHQIEFVIK
jgi:hypothetical protein